MYQEFCGQTETRVELQEGTKTTQSPPRLSMQSALSGRAAARGQHSWVCCRAKPPATPQGQHQGRQQQGGSQCAACSRPEECGEEVGCGQSAAVLLETTVGCFLDPSYPSQGITFNSSKMALDPRVARGSGRATHADRVPAHRVPSPCCGLPRFSASGVAARPKAPRPQRPLCPSPQCGSI